MVAGGRQRRYSEEFKRDAVAPAARIMAAQNLSPVRVVGGCRPRPSFNHGIPSGEWRLVSPGQATLAGGSTGAGKDRVSFASEGW